METVEETKTETITLWCDKKLMVQVGCNSFGIVAFEMKDSEPNAVRIKLKPDDKVYHDTNLNLKDNATQDVL